MTNQDNRAALLALARARGIEIDESTTHLSLRQVADVAGESEITTRRAIWDGVLATSRSETKTGFRYQIALDDAADYLAAGGGRGRVQHPKEGE